METPTILVCDDEADIVSALRIYLEAEGYLIKVEPIKHNVGTCQRCHTVVEPVSYTHLTLPTNSLV